MTGPTADAWACDTSVAVAALDPNHQHHAECRREVLAHRPVLAGHATFETYSVLTRLPPPLRLTALQAAVGCRTFLPSSPDAPPPSSDGGRQAS